MNKHSRRVVGGLAAVMVGGLLLLIGVGGAAAHSELIGSSPGDGQRPRGAVTEVALTFEEPVDSALTHVVVVGEGGRAKLGAVSVDRTVVRVPVTPLDVAGDYRISYRVVSADGHPVQGSIDFTVSAASARAARAMSNGAGPEAAPSGQEPGSGTAPEVTAGAASGDAAAALANAATASLGDQADAPWWRTNLPLLGLIVAALMIVVVSLARRARVGQVGASRG